MLNDALICAALRTPLGKRGGHLRPLSRTALAAQVQEALANRLKLTDARSTLGDLTLDRAIRAVQAGESACSLALAANAVSQEQSPDLDSESAAEIAARWKIGRQWLDQFTQESHEKAGLAFYGGFLKSEIVPVEVPYADGTTDPVDRDQLPRGDARLEEFSFLPPLKPNGIITSAHLTLLADGAAALALGTEAFARERALTPRVKIVSIASAEAEPRLRGVSAVPAAEMLLEQAGRHKIEIGLWEIHEITASHAVATLAELDPPLDRVNVWGGALALGDAREVNALRMVMTLSYQMACYGVKFGVAAWNENDVRGRAVLLELIA